jgi:TonB family protein
VAKALGSEAVQNSFAKLNSKAALSKLLQNQSRFLSNWKKDAGLKQLELAQFSSASLAKGLNGSFAGSAGGDRSLSGVGGGAGEGKGYGNGAGTGAGVSGQGQGIVSLETRLAKVEEGLTADEVGEVIHRHAAEIRYCYEDSLLRNPSIEGKLQLLFKISPRGVVSSTEIRSSNLGDARLEDCIIRKLSTWKFPTPKGGIEVPVTYPFVFKNLERSVRAQR